MLLDGLTFLVLAQERRVAVPPRLLLLELLVLGHTGFGPAMGLLCFSAASPRVRTVATCSICGGPISAGLTMIRQQRLTAVRSVE